MSSSKFLKAHCSFRALNTVSAKMNSIKRTFADSQNIYIITDVFDIWESSVPHESGKEQHFTVWQAGKGWGCCGISTQPSRAPRHASQLKAAECSQAAGNSAPVEGMEMVAQNKLGEEASAFSGEQSGENTIACARERCLQLSLGS